MTERICSLDLSLYDSSSTNYQNIESNCNRIEFWNLSRFLFMRGTGVGAITAEVAYPIIYVNEWPLYPCYYYSPTGLGTQVVMSNQSGGNHLVLECPDSYSILTDVFSIRVDWGRGTGSGPVTNEEFILGVKKLSYQDSPYIQQRYDRMNTISRQRQRPNDGSDGQY